MLSQNVSKDESDELIAFLRDGESPDRVRIMVREDTHGCYIAKVD